MRSTERKIEQLINTLRQKNDWMTTQALSSALQINSRSVRYLVSLINQEGERVISSNHGYRLNDVIEKPKASDSSIPSNYEERKKYIIDQLAVFNNNISISEAVDYLCISPYTFNNELTKIKKDLEPYNVYIKSKNNRLYLVASAVAKNQLIMSIINDELSKASMNIETLQKFFHRVKLDQIQQIVLGIFAKYQYYLDEYSLLIYILHLALRIEFTDYYHEASYSYTIDELKKIANPEIVDMVIEIFDQISTYNSKATFSLDDIAEASLLMTTRLLKDEKSTQIAKDIVKIVGQDVTDLINEIVESVNEIYHVNINSERFMMRFAIHIKNLLIRAQNSKTIQNGQFTNIKNEYPFVYVIAVHIAYVISNRYNVTLSEDEIAYLAIHVGLIIEETTEAREKLVCIVVAPDYYAIGKKLCQKIVENFDNELLIDQLTTTYNDDIPQGHGIDLVVSTVPIENCSFPNIVTGPFINENNVEDIRERLISLKHQKRKTIYFNRIKKFMKEEICRFDVDYIDREETITSICRDLYEMKLIRDDFKDALLKREEFASSSLRNIAICHTLSNDNISSFISVITSKKGIDWGNNLVNLVFIISLEDKDRDLFNEVFSLLGLMLGNDKVIEKMINVNSYEELQNVIMYYL
ncbi:MAG: PTS sugar transporter subunit IIA [Erysipelotrichaceae bacterium]|nr:PTS sugar transporter subunit IIA [Erysipelotrichaceae bacterium]